MKYSTDKISVDVDRRLLARIDRIAAMMSRDRSKEIRLALRKHVEAFEKKPYSIWK